MGIRRILEAMHIVETFDLKEKGKVFFMLLFIGKTSCFMFFKIIATFHFVVEFCLIEHVIDLLAVHVELSTLLLLQHHVV